MPVTILGDATDSLTIPGEITARRTWNIPPQEIPLPLAVHPARPALYCLMAFFGAFELLLFGLCGLLIYTVIDQAQKLNFAVILPCAVILIVTAIGLKVLFLWAVDAFRNGPSLVVRRDGLNDNRAECFVPWGCVASAKLHGPVSLLVRETMTLTLREPILAKQQIDGFRFRLFSREPSNILQIKLGLLDRSPFTLSNIIETLVKQNGGIIQD